MTIKAAALLPNIQFTATPAVSRLGYSGSKCVPVISSSGATLFPRNLTERTSNLNLSLTQTVFNFSQFSVVAQQVSLSRAADATLNAALQNLMIRVSSAYFAVLQDEDNLNYARASREAFAEQLDQIRQQYKVGLKTLTDVYTAQASYDAAVATFIRAKSLSPMTGKFACHTGVTHLSSLSDDFPAIRAKYWLGQTIGQNWNIKASRRSLLHGKILTSKWQVIYPMPTLKHTKIHGCVTIIFLLAIVGRGFFRSHLFKFHLLFSNWRRRCETRQAKYNYQVAQQRLEQTFRSTINTTNKVIWALSLALAKLC